MASCPYCHKYFSAKQAALDHIEKFHSVDLDRDGMDAAQSLYFSTHGSTSGTCICGCGKPTGWNYRTGKPYKVSNDPKCRERLRKAALENHVRVYGKETLLNDMEHQKEMEKHRHTAGEYKFSDGGTVPYLSKPEKNFLMFCDTVLELESRMVQESPKTFTYHDPKTNTDRQYIPDYYLPDYNLIVEIKDGGNHANTNPAFIKETKYKVALKDAVMASQTEFNYIKIVNQTYGPFVEVLYNIVHKDENPTMKKKKALIVITEAACVDPVDDNNFNAEIENETGELYLVVGYMLGNMIGPMGFAESKLFGRIYLCDSDGNTRVTSRIDSAFDGCHVETYKCILPDDDTRVIHFKYVYKSICENQHNIPILRALGENQIYFTDHYGHTNSEHNYMCFVPYKGGD